MINYVCIAKVCETGFITDAPRCESTRTVRVPVNAEARIERMHENLLKMTRHHSPELNISHTSLRPTITSNV